MVHKIKRYIWLCLVCFTFFMSCDQKLLDPKSEDICFTLTLQHGRIPGAEIFGLGATGTSIVSGEGLCKRLDIQVINLVRVMVVDLSAYNTWNDLLEREEWLHYVEARDAWSGDLSQWGEWEKLIGSHFNIVTNQTLDIVGEYATGTVTGVIGLNRIVVALIENGQIVYWGEAEVDGAAGVAEEIEVEVWEHYVEP